MQLEQTHIDQITAAFKKMQSKEDLLHLLNEAKPLVYGEKAVPFELKQLTWYANPKLGGKRYTEFKIRKKSGATRSIHSPVKGLKSLQKTLSFILQCVFEPHHAAMGFVRDKSIVDNARFHEASKYVYNIDLKDFFPSIDQARVWKCLQLRPFHLSPNGPENKINDINNNTEYFFELMPASLKRRDKILMYSYNTKRYKKIAREIVTEKGCRIAYKIEKAQDNTGVVIVYKNRTDLKAIYSIAKEYVDEKKLEISINSVVSFLIEKAIDKDQKSISSTNQEIGLASIIASLCCTEMEVERKNGAGEWEKVKRKVLPQGAPTSPVITNIVCQRLDYLLSGVARRFGLKYSRYADDITFSSMYNVYQPESDFLKELHRIILEQGFHIKENKTRLQKDGYRKEVTGLLVNEKTNVQQRYIKQLRMWLYYWERYDYERASGFFLQEYFADKGHVKKGKPDMANVILGKLNYLKMIKGSENQLYLKLKGRFEKLINLENPINKLLDIWENEGINKAMELHYQNIRTNEQI